MVIKNVYLQLKICKVFVKSIRLIHKGEKNGRNNRSYVNDYEDVLSLIPSYLLIWTGSLECNTSVVGNIHA